MGPLVLQSSFSCRRYQLQPQQPPDLTRVFVIVLIAAALLIHPAPSVTNPREKCCPTPPPTRKLLSNAIPLIRETCTRENTEREQEDAIPLIRERRDADCFDESPPPRGCYSTNPRDKRGSMYGVSSVSFVHGCRLSSDTAVVHRQFFIFCPLRHFFLSPGPETTTSDVPCENRSFPCSRAPQDLIRNNF